MKIFSFSKGKYFHPICRHDTFYSAQSTRRTQSRVKCTYWLTIESDGQSHVQRTQIKYGTILSVETDGCHRLKDEMMDLLLCPSWVAVSWSIISKTSLSIATTAFYQEDRPFFYLSIVLSITLKISLLARVSFCNRRVAFKA